MPKISELLENPNLDKVNLGLSMDSIFRAHSEKLKKGHEQRIKELEQKISTYYQELRDLSDTIRWCYKNKRTSDNPRFDEAQKNHKEKSQEEEKLSQEKEGLTFKINELKKNIDAYDRIPYNERTLQRKAWAIEKLGEAATQALETELTSRIVSDNLNDNNAAQPLITSAPHYTHFKPSQPKTELAVGELNDLMSSLLLTINKALPVKLFEELNQLIVNLNLMLSAYDENKFIAETQDFFDANGSGKLTFGKKTHDIDILRALNVVAVNKPDEFKETLKGLDVKFLEELKNNTSRFFIALFASMQYPKTANNAGRFKEIIKYFACLQEAFESINTTQNTFN